MKLKRALERIPADREAEDRAWAVVRSAFVEREVVPQHRAGRWWPVAVVGVAAVCAAAALSPPGRAVVNAVRRSIGIEHAAPALFKLPSSGRLLVSGRGGTWVIAADGSKRRLGSWSEAAWSPHGLFVVASSRDGLAAVEPRDGTVRWSLARPDVSLPSWGGTRTDTRIAYLQGRSLRVVAGDGTGDRLLARTVARVAPVWQPERHVVAFVSGPGVVVVRNVDSGAVLARHRVGGVVRSLAWSADGSRIVYVSATGTPYLRRVTVASGETADFAQDTASLGQPACNAQMCLAVSGAYGGTGNLVSVSTAGGSVKHVSAVTGSEASPAFVQQ